VILDFYHAAEYLNDWAKAVHPGNETASGAMAAQWCHRLKHEGGAVVLAELRSHDVSRHSAAAREEHQKVLGYFDIVALREINATFGLRAGDEAIVRAAQLIRRALAPLEIACRLAGDSFVIHLPARDAAGAAELGAEIAQAVADLGYTTGGGRIQLALRWGTAAPDAALTETRQRRAGAGRALVPPSRSASRRARG
jgi:diguanylate cyclase (GGDEF)-like protein